MSTLTLTPLKQKRKPRFKPVDPPESAPWVIRVGSDWFDVRRNPLPPEVIDFVPKLERYCRSKSFCAVGTSELSASTGLSVQTTLRRIRLAEKAGALVVIREEGGDRAILGFVLRQRSDRDRAIVSSSEELEAAVRELLMTPSTAAENLPRAAIYHDPMRANLARIAVQPPRRARQIGAPNPLGARQIGAPFLIGFEEYSEKKEENVNVNDCMPAINNQEPLAEPEAKPESIAEPEPEVPGPSAERIAELVEQAGSRRPGAAMARLLLNGYGRAPDGSVLPAAPEGPGSPRSGGARPTPVRAPSVAPIALGASEGLAKAPCPTIADSLDTARALGAAGAPGPAPVAADTLTLLRRIAPGSGYQGVRVRREEVALALGRRVKDPRLWDGELEGLRGNLPFFRSVVRDVATQAVPFEAVAELLSSAVSGSAESPWRVFTGGYRNLKSKLATSKRRTLQPPQPRPRC